MSDAIRIFDPEGNGGSGEPAKAGPLTVRAVVEARLTHLLLLLQAGEYSRDSYDNANRDLRKFSKLFGAVAVVDCRQDDLFTFLVNNPQWKSNSTKRRVLNELLACFRWAEDDRLIDRTPYRWPRGIKLPSQPRREADASEYIAMMKHGSRPLRRALYFLWNSAARTIEMRELEPSWIDWKTGVIWFRRHKTFRVTGKAKGIGLSARVLRFIKNVCRQMPTGQSKVFLNNYGTPWDRHTFARHLRRCAKKIGLDDAVIDRVSAYCLRHSAMGEGLEAEMGDQMLADQFGHAGINLVGYYGAQTRRRAGYLKGVAETFEKKRKQVRRSIGRASSPNKPPNHESRQQE